MGTDNISSTAGQASERGNTARQIQMYTSTTSLVIFCVIFVVGTVGNGLVIYVTGFKMKRTVNSVWFLNLALADFLFTIFLIFSIVSLSLNGQWPFGLLMCKLGSFVALVNMFASVFLLTAISLDRCLSIWVVVWAQNKRTVTKAQLITAGIWVAAGVCSTPYATFRTLSTTVNSTRCVYSRTMSREQKWCLYTFRFVMGFLIPFLVIVVSNVAIDFRATRLQRTRRRRSRRIIFAIIFAFFICWLPFHIMNFLELGAWSNKNLRPVVQIGGPLTLNLAFLNSCLNPILYVFMCDEFQKKIKQSICFVLENALAEDYLSFMSSRSLASHFSKMSRKSDSSTPVEGKNTSSSPTFTECNVVFTEETQSTE